MHCLGLACQTLLNALRTLWLCKCLVLCTDSKKELDARAKALVKEATSPKKTMPKKTTPKKTTPKKTTTIKKGKSAKETRTRGSSSANRTKGKSGDKVPKGKKTSKKSQEKLAEIQRVQKEAEWMFRSTELEVSSLHGVKPVKCGM